jgi:hypothetical protein
MWDYMVENTGYKENKGICGIGEIVVELIRLALDDLAPRKLRLRRLWRLCWL